MIEMYQSAAGILDDAKIVVKSPQKRLPHPDDLL
jgi:hypothetical protein